MREGHDRQRRCAVDGGGSALAEYITGGNVLLSLIINFCTSFCECPAPPHTPLATPHFKQPSPLPCFVGSLLFCVCVCMLSGCVLSMAKDKAIKRRYWQRRGRTRHPYDRSKLLAHQCGVRRGRGVLGLGK